MKIVKRNGSEEEFDITKIIVAITKANEATDADVRMTPMQIRRISESVVLSCESLGYSPSVEQVQDMVEHQIMGHGAFEVAKAYITYRYTRNLVRESNTTDERILYLLERSKHESVADSKKPLLNATQRDYIAGEISKDLTKRILLSPTLVQAHENGLLYLHDMNYFAQHMHESEWVNLEDMLQNGTVIGDTLIEKPHSFATACSIATQILAQIASNQSGPLTISLWHLIPFVSISRYHLQKRVEDELALIGIKPNEDQLKKIVAQRLKEEIRRGVQTLQYQSFTLLSSAGRAPQVNIFLYLNEASSDTEREDYAMVMEELLRQRIEGVKDPSGQKMLLHHPHLLYVLQEDNLGKGSQRYRLTVFASALASQGVLSFVSEKKMLEIEKRRPLLGRPYGLVTQGTVTVNLVDIAFSSHKDPKAFDTLLAERLDLCHQILMEKNKRLSGTLSDAAPILWQHGGVSRLSASEKIDSVIQKKGLLRLGFCGMDAACQYMTGKNLPKNGALLFAKHILEEMDEARQCWSEAEGLHYCLSAEYDESVLNHFRKHLTERFGQAADVYASPKCFRGGLCFNNQFDLEESLKALENVEYLYESDQGGNMIYLDASGDLDLQVLDLIPTIYENSLGTDFEIIR